MFYSLRIVHSERATQPGAHNPFGRLPRKQDTISGREAMKRYLTLLTVLLLSFSASAEMGQNGRAYFISPQDGETVPQTFTVRFGLAGMGVAPAGMERAGTGHHHLLIDLDTLPDLDKPLPANDHIRHFGGGQTETELTLPPGKHTLQLLMGNHMHVPHNPPVLSEKITINVE
jgi:hypothetical protein